MVNIFLKDKLVSTKIIVFDDNANTIIYIYVSISTGPKIYRKNEPLKLEI